MTFNQEITGNLLSTTDPTGLTKSYTYNGFNEAVAIVSPDTGESTLRYDSAGKLASKPIHVE